MSKYVDCHTAPSYIQVTLKASKTDPFSRGVVLYWATGKELCPVVAVLSFMVARGSMGGTLFTWKNGIFLMRNKFVKCLRTALGEAGYLADKFVGHSFRIGVATTAKRCGIQESLIKTLGRWESAVYLDITRDTAVCIQNPGVISPRPGVMEIYETVYIAIV